MLTAETIEPLSLLEITSGADNCTMCARHKLATSRTYITGSKGARVMFMGDGPTYLSNKKRTPFIEQDSGMDRMLMHMGIGRPDVLLGYTVLCPPILGKRDRPLPIALEDQQACLVWTKALLEYYLPDFVVCLGYEVARIFFPEIKTKLEFISLIGDLKKSPLFKCGFLLSPEPSVLLQDAHVDDMNLKRMLLVMKKIQYFCDTYGLRR